MSAETRRFAVALAGVTLLAAALRADGIAAQPPLADEVEMAFTAESYVTSGEPLPTMPHPPNLRNLLIAASAGALGFGALGLRLASLVLGVLSVPLLALVVRQVSGRDAAAVLAAFLLAVDPLHVTFSRQAIQETHVVFFALAGVSLGLAYLRRLERGAPGAAADALLPAAGVAFGLALASKLQAAFPLVVVGALLVRSTLRARDPGRLALTVVSLAILPLTIVALTDAPWFGRGYDLADWALMRRAVFDRMSSSYVPAEMEVNPDRSAWEWFLRPFLGYASFSMAHGKPFVVVGMGNPLVWMLVLPSALWAAASAAACRRTLVLQALFWSSYVPFLLPGRPIFFLTALAVAPFAFALVAAAADELASGGHRKLVGAYGVAVLLSSLLMTPLETGASLEHGYTAALVRRFAPPGEAPPAR